MFAMFAMFSMFAFQNQYTPKKLIALAINSFPGQVAGCELLVAAFPIHLRGRRTTRIIQISEAQPSSSIIGKDI